MNWLYARILELVKRGDHRHDNHSGGRYCEESIDKYFRHRNVNGEPGTNGAKVREAIQQLLDAEMIFRKGDHHGGTELTANHLYRPLRKKPVVTVEKAEDRKIW
jgi:hypothetical protein